MRTARAQSEQEPSASDVLQRRGHASQHPRVSIGNVQDQWTDSHIRNASSDCRKRSPAFEHRLRLVHLPGQMVPGPDAAEALVRHRLGCSRELVPGDVEWIEQEIRNQLPRR